MAAIKAFFSVPPTTIMIMIIAACAIAALYIIQEIERVVDNERRETTVSKVDIQLNEQTNILKSIFAKLADDRHDEHEAIMDKLDGPNLNGTEVGR